MQRSLHVIALAALVLASACGLPSGPGEEEVDERPTLVNLSAVEGNELARRVSAVVHGELDRLQAKLVAQAAAGQALPSTWAATAQCGAGGAVRMDGTLTTFTSGPETPWIGFSSDGSLAFDGCAMSVFGKTVTLRSSQGGSQNLMGHRLQRGSPLRYKGDQLLLVGHKADSVQITVASDAPVRCNFDVSSNFVSDENRRVLHGLICQTRVDESTSWDNRSQPPLLP
ncbi:MAG TPA: hypothetical protein VF613_24690 [Longimicrobium sp.]|jgi:hypothetical protein